MGSQDEDSAILDDTITDIEISGENQITIDTFNNAAAEYLAKSLNNFRKGFLLEKHQLSQFKLEQQGPQIEINGNINQILTALTKLKIINASKATALTKEHVAAVSEFDFKSEKNLHMKPA